MAEIRKKNYEVYGQSWAEGTPQDPAQNLELEAYEFVSKWISERVRFLTDEKIKEMTKN
jgi:hypothetical protein